MKDRERERERERNEGEREREKTHNTVVKDGGASDSFDTEKELDFKGPKSFHFTSYSG
jgi:hypothetical protein